MRKTKITLLICILLLVCGLACGFSYLENGKKLTVNVKTIYGDLAVAEGLEINGVLHAIYLSKDIWEIQYKVNGANVDMSDSFHYTDSYKDLSGSICQSIWFYLEETSYKLGCYPISCYSEEAIFLNITSCPGECGIYRLPNRYSEENVGYDKFEMDVNDLTHIFTVGYDQELVEFEYNDIDDTLLVFVKEGGNVYLNVLNPYSGVVLQKVMVSDDFEIPDIYIGEGYCALVLDNRPRIIVLVQDENGLYSKTQDFIVSGEDSAIIHNNCMAGDRLWSLAYKDGKVAVIYYAPKNGFDSGKNQMYWERSNANRTLVVWDDGKLAYMGEIDNSLGEVYNGEVFSSAASHSSGVSYQPPAGFDLSWK